MKSRLNDLIAAPHMPYHEDSSLALEQFGFFADCAPVSDTSAACAPIAK